MFDDKRQREDPDLGGAGMADIAFLLLIFFLLVTTIDVDTGIYLTLPPAPQENQPPPKINDRNILNILVNASGAVQIDEEPVAIDNVKQTVKGFVDNKGADPDLSTSPEDAVVSLKTTRDTPYKTYINVFDEIVGAYIELRNTAAQAEFGRDYTELEDGSPAKEKIQDMYPRQLSIAEPDEGG